MMGKTSRKRQPSMQSRCGFLIEKRGGTEELVCFALVEVVFAVVPSPVGGSCRVSCCAWSCFAAFTAAASIPGTTPLGLKMPSGFTTRALGDRTTLRVSVVATTARPGVDEKVDASPFSTTSASTLRALYSDCLCVSVSPLLFRSSFASSFLWRNCDFLRYSPTPTSVIDPVLPAEATDSALGDRRKLLMLELDVGGKRLVVRRFPLSLKFVSTGGEPQPRASALSLFHYLVGGIKTTNISGNFIHTIRGRANSKRMPCFMHR
mmetsp:Transcript_7042/g.17090  ORF Transcript_7042/g.17090 Transcript_7042/m.17090 type:complete len:263 (+) Transcript_7042:2408-3196(+)